MENKKLSIEQELQKLDDQIHYLRQFVNRDKIPFSVRELFQQTLRNLEIKRAQIIDSQ